jgi:hypothetical protein
LIVIKSDKVEFLGGPNLTPIITLVETKIEGVSMSPDEKYVLTYAPHAKENPYIVWDFHLVKKIRTFD